MATWQHYARQYPTSKAAIDLGHRIGHNLPSTLNFNPQQRWPLTAGKALNLNSGSRRVRPGSEVPRGSSPAADTADLVVSEVTQDNSYEKGSAVYNGDDVEIHSRGLGNNTESREQPNGSVNGANGDGASGIGANGDETEAFWERRREEKAQRAKSEDKGDEVSERVAISPAQLAAEVERRRNFAIISHPDAGKTTLTEKLLLYGGAIHEAGTVKARRAAKSATSDWMELEKQRGISITSTAMVFETRGKQITLLDTPGHQDFGEDTYRTLAAADNAVMLVDAGKGLEPQTRKLFEVCRMRRLPVFTFINKMDRPALDAFQLCDEIEKEFSLPTYPINWPIGSGDRFRGLYHRPTKTVHLFWREKSQGRVETRTQVLAWGDERIEEMVEKELFDQLVEEVELLEELTPPLDLPAVHAGNLSLVFFGSAFNNFGLQANMDAKHRDKVAFVRVCSGAFEKGMKVQVARTNKTIALTRPQKMFAQERATVETGFAGDVIGLNNPNAFAIGDTVYVGPKLSYPPIPSFAPELFSYMCNPNPSKYKQFRKGLEELLGEGAVQVLYSLEGGRADPILAAVGQLQFEVVQYRMQSEYGVETSLDPLSFSTARWVENGWDAVQKLGRLFNCTTVKDQWGRPVLLFRNEWNVDQLVGDHPEIGPLQPYALPPVEIQKR